MSLYKAIILNIFISTVFAYRSNLSVTLLTSKDFYNLVRNDDIWVLHFYSSKADKNKNFDNAFATSADILKGIVKFGTLDVEDSVELVKNFTFNVKSLPVVQFHGVLEDGKPKEYTGPKTVKDLVASVLKNISEKVKKKLRHALPKNHIEEVNDENFDDIITNSKEPWLVLFYAPWCIHCKELKPIWKQVATSLQNKVKCASLDAIVNKIKAKEYQITHYPTVKLLPFESKSLQDSFDYTRERTVDSIIDWVSEMLPGPQVVEIISTEVFQTHCMPQNLCIISILPPIFDCQSDCRKNYLSILKQLGDKFKHKSWAWVWIEGGTQEDLEVILDVGGFGYPALVVLNPIKMKYSVFKGAFTTNKIKEFLSEMTKMKAVRVEENVAQSIVTTKAWDGKDSVNDLPEKLYLYDTEFHKKDEL